MKTIDADALMLKLEKEKNDTLDAIVRFGMSKSIDIVRNAPAIEVRDNFDIGYIQGLEDGRKERTPSNKRTPNKWIGHYDNLSQSFYWACDICNYKQSWGRFKYCPNCGADMRGEEADYQKLMGNIKHGDCENCAHCIPAGSVSFCELPSCDFEALGGEST